MKGRIVLSGGLLVEEVPVTLISPKAMFHNEGIRTYFNDDLYFPMPTGEILDFVETDRSHILPLADDGEDSGKVLIHVCYHGGT